MTFDVSDTLAPKSDQLDAVELLGSPRTFTIESVSRNSDEQPLNISLVGFPRYWRPGVSMRRVLASLWGTDAKKWVGRSVTLYCDERVKFGSETTGGTRISHMTDIGDAPRKVPLQVSRGKFATFTVQPLSKVDALRAEWKSADPERRKVIEAEVEALTAPAADDVSANDPANEVQS